MTSEKKLLSIIRMGQPECDHLLGVTNQEDIANQHRMVPGLALVAAEGQIIAVSRATWIPEARLFGYPRPDGAGEDPVFQFQ